MKTLYTSPVITVEELAKLDVLCSSPVVNTNKVKDNLVEDLTNGGGLASIL